MTVAAADVARASRRWTRRGVGRHPGEVGAEGRAEEAERAGVLFFDRAHGDAEAVGDFLMGKQFDFAEQEDSGAAFGELRDGLLEVAVSATPVVKL